MQQDLDLMKAENKQLKDIINSKNQTINDFQGLFQASKSKFELFNQTQEWISLFIKLSVSDLNEYSNSTESIEK